MATVLITGGLGNLGCWMTRHFVKHGYEVIAVSRKSRNICGLTGFQFVECDLSNPSDCKRKLGNLSVDIVVHLACADDNFDESYPRKALLTNTLGSRNILETISGHCLKNFIYFSTFHVYGTSEGEIDENKKPAPRHDYATTHLFAEEYVKQFHRTHDVPYTILRLTNSYGCPFDLNGDKWHLILNNLARMAIEKNEIRINSDEQLQRDFVWMGDVVKAVQHLSESDEPFNGIYNLSGEDTLRLIDVAKVVQTAYSQICGEWLQITTPAEHSQKPGRALSVPSAKLRGRIAYNPSNRMIAEAEAIMKLIAPTLDPIDSTGTSPR